MSGVYYVMQKLQGSVSIFLLKTLMGFENDLSEWGKNGELEGKVHTSENLMRKCKG